VIGLPMTAVLIGRLTGDKQYASVADDYRLEHRAPLVGAVDIPRCCCLYH